MSAEIYRYKFARSVPFEEVEASLVLALLATESLHGQAQVRLDAGHAAEAAKRTCVIDASTPVGRDLNRLFVGFIGREFGPDAFEVERVDSVTAHKPEEVAA
ncbi:MAG: hypothetical protein WD063_14900 [Pirellulales bacterium]